MKVGIIKEGKIPPDERVPFSPAQCRKLLEMYSNLKIAVQPSPIRAFKDEEYEAADIPLQEDLSDCDLLMGVKEVNIEDLIPHKKYMFFSHTYKKQPYNRNLLRAILDKKIQLIDYELLTDKNGVRLVAFGYYAGIVGAYNGLRGWGLRYGLYELKPAHRCFDKKEVEEQLKNVKFEQPIKILITGHGRVAKGAVEILEKTGIKHVSVNDYLTRDFSFPVFTQIHVDHYHKRINDNGFDHEEFYKDPSKYKSDFLRFAHESDMYIACHYWDSRAPMIFTHDEARSPDFRIRMIADISCDINGPIPSTIRPSTIEDPFYGYDPISEKECDFFDKKAIGVMAVDNLPCELPRDASEFFGDALIENVMPAFLDIDPDNIIERASETNLEGELMPAFRYLENYVKGLE